MPLFRSIRFGVACILVVAGCGNHPPANNPATAPQQIQDSFAVNRAGIKPTISIAKSSLEKEFLLQTNIMEQPVVPAGNSLKSRIVAFRKHQGRLFMVEATDGHTVSADFPQTLLLATFPILSETENAITFDFNEGMSQVFTASDWRGHDVDGGEYRPEFSSLRTRFSDVIQVELTADNQLMIRQIAQVAIPRGGSENNISIEVKYYLKPYRPSADFEIAETTGFEKAGFFEVAPQLGRDGNTVIRLSKFHHNKPIVLAVSSNTPPQFKEAVRDGILYWNKALKEVRIQVIDAPPGVVAPNIRYNVIQWIQWDQAEFAYADAQMDPRTGEILHAQAYVPSMFAVPSIAHARHLLNRIRASKSRPAQRSHIGISGFGANELCHFDVSSFEGSLPPVLAVASDDSKILKASQDYVRHLVAHEVGHLLGLRHNFAGSLGTTLSLSERQRLFRTYLEEGKLPSDKVTTSSVMDYLHFEDAAMAGHHIGKRSEALDYDEKAIQILYRKKSYPSQDMPSFCTDSHKSKLNDCRPFDVGSSVVEYSAWTINQMMEDLAFELIEKYVGAKSPASGARVHAVESVSFEPAAIIRSLLRGRGYLADTLSYPGRLLSVARNFPYVGPVNLDAVGEAELKYVTDELERVGGHKTVFAFPAADFAQKTAAKFDALLESPRYLSGVGPGGLRYEFTSSELETMKVTARQLLKVLQTELVKADVESLGKIKLSPVSTALALNQELAKAIKARVEAYVFPRSGETIKAQIQFVAKNPDPNPVTLNVELGKFLYPVQIREAAAGLLNGLDEELPELAKEEKTQFKERFSRLIDTEMDFAVDQLKADELVITPQEMKRPVLRWISENLKIKAAVK